jgi:hypothetical protein
MLDFECWMLDDCGNLHLAAETAALPAFLIQNQKLAIVIRQSIACPTNQCDKNRLRVAQ